MADPRYTKVLLAADHHTRYPEDSEAWDELCAACERISDSEWDALHRGDARARLGLLDGLPPLGESSDVMRACGPKEGDRGD